MLPDRSVLMEQKLAENDKIKNSNATFGVIVKQREKVTFLFTHFGQNMDSWHSVLCIR